MTKFIMTVVSCAGLLWMGAAQAAPGAQQRCDAARITASKVYTACVEAVVAKDAKGLNGNTFVPFARCRHKYFTAWTKFQATAELAGTTCIGPRLLDNGDQTVTDNLTGLAWEKKDALGTFHDKDNIYSWSVDAGLDQRENGTAFTSFLDALNSGAGFAGANGWRLPTLIELQTIVRDFACRGRPFSPSCRCGSGPSDPCIDATFGPTQPFLYFTSTSDLRFQTTAWTVTFDFGSTTPSVKTYETYVRAVRGGL